MNMFIYVHMSFSKAMFFKLWDSTCWWVVIAIKKRKISKRIEWETLGYIAYNKHKLCFTKLLLCVYMCVLDHMVKEIYYRWSK